MTFRLTCSLLFLLTDLVSAQVALVTPPPAPLPPLPTTAGAVASASPTPFSRYENTGVFHVRNECRPSRNQETDACMARRDDVICIYARHLKSWMNDPQLIGCLGETGAVLGDDPGLKPQ
jgi:hypothetical protein